MVRLYLKITLLKFQNFMIKNSKFLIKNLNFL